MKNIKLCDLNVQEEKYFYRNEEKESGFIGYLRGDFGRNGNEFHFTWFPGVVERPSGFKQEFNIFIDQLRENGKLLSNFSDMQKNLVSKMKIASIDNYGFKFESSDYVYFVRCTPRIGDYNFYVFAYVGTIFYKEDTKRN